MAGYGNLQNIIDPNVYAAFKQLTDQVLRLTNRIAALEGAAVQAGTAIDATSHKIVNLVDGTAASDAATVGQLRAYTDAVKKATY